MVNSATGFSPFNRVVEASCCVNASLKGAGVPGSNRMRSGTSQHAPCGVLQDGTDLLDGHAGKPFHEL